MNEFYKIHRPTAFKHVIGQKAAVDIVRDFVEKDAVPHTIMFTGPSGVGKTTLARILVKKLDCGEQDFTEINCADFRGIDMVRDIRTRMQLAPISGKCRVWLIDECHQLSKDAQNAFLKMLEDTPKHVYFMLATTEPTKLLPTILTRCTEIKLKTISAEDMGAVIDDIAQLEDLKLDEEVRDKIIEHSEGSARKALVLLNAIANIEGKEEQLRAVEANDSKAAAIELARALLGKKPWNEVAAIIKTLDDEPEGVRRLILAYAGNVLLNSNNGRAFELLDVFQHDFFASGKGGLIAACYAVTKR